MKRALPLLAVLASLSFVVSCAERGDKAIARGSGLGHDWREPASSKLMRITLDNAFTRDVWIEADGGGKHYELTVGPIREGYMIVPIANYEIKAYTRERSTGIMKLNVITDDYPPGTKGLRANIRF